MAAPFDFPERFERARTLVDKHVRAFETTSAGRLFDSAAAVLGFTRAVTFEGQAAIWLEQLGRRAEPDDLPDLSFTDRELDWRPLLQALVERRLAGREPSALAAGFHRSCARGLAAAVRTLLHRHELDTLVCSGGVFQNELLLQHLFSELPGVDVWINRAVPANDGGISLGQAALALAGAE
jgi:hydrogenase maturation protein HypF